MAVYHAVVAIVTLGYADAIACAFAAVVPRWARRFRAAPAHQQQQVRTQLSFVLEGIVCQQLVTRSDGRGRVLASEVLLATPAVRALIRDDKAHQIPSAIQTGGKLGMRTMNQSLYELYRTRQITYEEALSRSTDVEELKRIFQRQS